MKKLKRLVCGLLAGITVLGAAQTTAFAASPKAYTPASSSAYTATAHYADVPADAYYATAVEWARANGITSDQTDKFCPNENIKRCDFVLMLYRLEGSPAKPLHDEDTERIVAEFGDVPTNAYYYSAVCWAVRCSITGGCSDGKFNPNASITNKETIQFLYAVAHSNKVKNIKSLGTAAGKLTKTWNTSDWYYDACEWANNKGYFASVPAFAMKAKFLAGSKTNRALMVYLLWEMQTGFYEKTNAEALGLNNTSLNAQQRALLFYAESRLGAPYSGSGSSYTSGICCSHYVADVLNESWGMNLPKTSCTNLQYCSGLKKVYQRNTNETCKDFYTRVKSQLKLGDILFFTENVNGTSLGHVGICLGVAGNGRVIMIHASSPVVQIHYLDSSRYVSNNQVDNWYVQRLTFVMRKNG